MNYLKHYIKLIRKSMRRTIDIDCYYEKHHIFPISIFGKNNKIVFLLPKEHYIAHFLLWKFFKKRYGIKNYKTKKMHFAFNQMTWNVQNNNQRYVSRTFDIARRASSVYNKGDNNPAKLKENKEKISISKKGKKRNDMIGKKYFGASDERIKEGIEKMANKKRGTKASIETREKLSKIRTGCICSNIIKEKISKSRKKTKEKFIAMSDEEFSLWLSKFNLYNKRGKLNSNITRAIKWREEYKND